MTHNPKIRFTRDDGSSYPDWATVSLSNIVGNITTGKVDANVMSENGRYRFYTCAKDYYYIDKFAFDDEAILISGNGANVGYIHYYKGKFNAYQRTYVLTDFKCYVFYLQYILEKTLKGRIEKEASKSNTPYITLSTLTEFQIPLPCLEEQEKIAEYFTGLDAQISEENQKLTDLKQYKKSMLQQIFSQTKRFTPHAGGNYPDWRAVALSEVCSLIKDGTHGTHKDVENGIPLLSAKDINKSIVNIPSDCRRISKEDFNKIHNRYSLQDNDILLTIVGTIGRCAIIKNYKDNIFTLQRSVAILRTKETCLHTMLFQLLQSDRLQKMLDINKSVSAQPGIYLGDLASLSIYIPTDPEEQEKIADYLSAIDEQITLQQQKCDDITLYKKSMLQQMMGSSI